MASKNGGNGRRKSAPTLIKEALDLSDTYLPQYFETPRKKALIESVSIRQRMECSVYLSGFPN